MNLLENLLTMNHNTNTSIDLFKIDTIMIELNRNEFKCKNRLTEQKYERK